MCRRSAAAAELGAGHGGLLAGTVVLLAQDAERAAVGSQGGAGVEPATSRRPDVVECLECVIAPAEDPPGPCQAEAFEP